MPGPGLAGPAKGVDWKAELLTYLGAKPDFRGAMEFLAEKAKGMEEPNQVPNLFPDPNGPTGIDAFRHDFPGEAGGRSQVRGPGRR